MGCGPYQPDYLEIQPRPQGLLLVQNGGRRNPWPTLPKWLQKFVRILSRKHDKMSSFRLNNGFRLQKNKQGRQTLETTPKKPFHHLSGDKILHDSWSISAALDWGFFDRHFERGEGPGDEVALDFCSILSIYSSEPVNGRPLILGCHLRKFKFKQEKGMAGISRELFFWEIE